MYLRRVRLENIRGLRELDVPLTRPDGGHAGWTVIAGPNGSGKSTLLRAIVLALLDFGEGHRLFGPISALWRRGSTERWRVRAELSRSDGSFAGSMRIQGATPHRRAASVTGVVPVAEFDGLEWSDFVAAYGPNRRLHAGDEVPPEPALDSRRVAAVQNLFRADHSLASGVAWLRDLDYRAVSGDAASGALREHLLALLSEGLLPPGIEVLKVTPDGLRVRDHGVELLLSDLSDGCRTVAALVIDLLLHMQRHFGEALALERRDGALAVTNPGLVLLDEVEQHLHPSWQRELGFWFKRHFPAVQFLVTTHSVFVAQAADPGGLVRLPAPGSDERARVLSEEEHRRVVHGTPDEAVLTSLFGLETLHTRATEALRGQVAALEAKLVLETATPAEEAEFERLRGQLPSSDASALEQSLRVASHLAHNATGDDEAAE